MRICASCGRDERNRRGDCNVCMRTNARLRREQRVRDGQPCTFCGGKNWTKGGTCRDCLLRARSNKSKTPCSVCGGRRDRFAACLTCKGKAARKSAGIRGAHGETGAGKPCDICDTMMTERGKTRYALDHNHKTGAVRGWLCLGCNAGLGSFKESPKKLRLAAAYLERHARSRPRGRQPG